MKHLLDELLERMVCVKDNIARTHTIEAETRLTSRNSIDDYKVLEARIVVDDVIVWYQSSSIRIEKDIDNAKDRMLKDLMTYLLCTRLPILRSTTVSIHTRYDV